MAHTPLIHCSLRIPPELIPQIDQLAQEMHWSRAETMRFVLMDYFRRYNAKVGFAPAKIEPTAKSLFDWPLK